MRTFGFLFRRLTTWLALAAAFAGAAASSEPAYPDVRFDFALIGDTPYNDLQETNLFPNLLGDLNRASLAFVVHNGDFKSGSTPCTDELFERRARQFATSRHPFVYLFGDNEWSDCGKVRTNAFDPEERLEKLRSVFTRGDGALGQRSLHLDRQSEVSGFGKFRENVRWVQGRVVFAGLNVPGNDNHVGTPEFGPRNVANIAWIHDEASMHSKICARTRSAVR